MPRRPLKTAWMRGGEERRLRRTQRTSQGGATSQRSRQAVFSGRLRPALGDAVLAHLGVQRRAAQPQQRGGGLFVPPRRLERLEDGGALDLLERARGHLRRRDRRRSGAALRSEERRVGKECSLTCRSRW